MAVRGPESPTWARPAPGKASLPHHLPGMWCRPPAAHPPAQEKYLSLILLLGWQEQGKHHARGLSPIAPDPSVAWKVPPGPGPLAKADAFEERAPHFTPRCTLSPQTCHRLASSHGLPPNFRPKRLRQGCSPATGAPHTLHTARGFRIVSWAGPLSLGPGPFPAALVWWGPCSIPTWEDRVRPQEVHSFICYSFILSFSPQIFTKPSLCMSIIQKWIGLHSPSALCGSEREIRKCSFSVHGARCFLPAQHLLFLPLVADCDFPWERIPPTPVYVVGEQAHLGLSHE